MLPWSKNTYIGIVGYGVEGKAWVSYLSTQGYENIVVYDKNDTIEIPAGIRFFTGKSYLDNLHHVDVIIRSPGTPVALVHEKSIKCIEGTDRRHEITSLTELIFDLVPATIIGVTGSNGKTTTTNLIEHILEVAGNDFLRFGNDSYPDIDAIFSLGSDAILLLEISSFQLEPLHKSPHIALLTNITPNHLDYHSSMQEYTEAKLNIARFQQANDYFITVHEISQVFEGKKITVPGPESPELPFESFSFKTHTNNVLMALEVARILGLDSKTVIDSLQTFKGVTHRLELVGTVDGVPCYNDSSSTTPESTSAALMQFHEKVVFLLGGSSKNLSFTQLGKDIVAHGAISVVYGATASEIKQAILNEDPEYTVFDAENMDEALEIGLKKAHECSGQHAAGVSLVLSPACASFDQFPNAKVRGKLFTEAVQKKAKNK